MTYNATPQRLPTSAYWDPDVFRDEMAFLQSKAWTFVGLTRDLPKANDFLTATVGGRSVTIQNFGGVLKAFDNVCSHRHCLIRTAPKGNGALRCPYHSWAYDQTGVPVVIPMAEDAFDITEEGRKALALHPWRLEQCGEFIFIRRDQPGPSLQNELGALYDELSQISRSLGFEVDHLHSRYEANWKVCVENTLDEYHAQFVHPTTFRQLLSRDFTYDYLEMGSRMRVAAAPDYLQKWGKVEKILGPRPIKTTDYFHYHLFPTMTIASTFGASFSLQTFIPIDAETTLLSSRLFFGESKAPAAVMASLGASAKAFNDTVFEEDRIICNQVQAGLRQSTKTGLIGKFEQRISHFQACLISAILRD